VFNLKCGMLKLNKSKKLLKKAEKLIPALSQTFSKAPYSYVEGIYPTYLKSGKGSHVFDVDGNKYIDYVLALGPITLGYAYPKVNKAISDQLKKGISFSIPHYLEVDLSEKLTKIIPGTEMVKFTKTGSDAATAAIRAARAITKKEKILFCGSAGVWHDWFTILTSRNKGIPKFNEKLIRKFEYNNLESIKICFEEWKGEVAAVYMEAMVGDYPKNNFLENVKKIAHKNNSVLIFDEVVTGFRYANGGAQEHLGINADISVWGKGMANGMPLGSITGKTEYMKIFDEIFYSTSYAGETLSLAASLAVMDEIETKPVINHLWKMGTKLKNEFNKLAIENNVNAEILGLPVRSALVFKDEKNKQSNLLKSIFLQELIQNGILFGPGAIFTSYSHSTKDMNFTIQKLEKCLKIIQKGISSGKPEKLMKGKPMKSILTY